MAKTIMLLHVLFATIWLGGSIYTESLLAGANRSGSPKEAMRTLSSVVRTNDRLFGAAGAGTVVFGFWLVIVTTWEFEMGWVAGGLVLALVAIALAIAFVKPKGQAFNDLIGERGLDDPEVLALGKQLQMALHAQTGILFVALLLMVYKP